MKIMNLLPLRMLRRLALVVSVSAAAFAEGPCAEVQRAKEHTYGFHPAALSKAEREQKSKQMDDFWNLVRAERPNGLDCVRELIASESADTYFLFDAASLLASLDPSGKSDRAILDGITRTDLKDVDPAGYIHLALQLSHRNADIGAAADKYLRASNITVYLPQHGAYEVNRVRGAILLYGSMNPIFVDKYLIPDLSSNEREVRDTAAIVLAQNMTELSFKALSSLGTMEGFSKDAQGWANAVRTRHKAEVTRPPKYTREQLLAKLAKLPEMDADIDEAENKALDNSVYATFTRSDLDALRDARRRMIVGVSDESVEGYEEFSHIILTLIDVLDAYSQYRTR